MNATTMTISPFNKLNLLRVEENSVVPKYAQIVEIILSDIENGIFKIGEMIPSIHETSMEFSIAKNTVEKAYKILKQKGIIKSIRGKGYFVSSGGSLCAKRILFIVSDYENEGKHIYESMVNFAPSNYEIDLYHYNGRPQLLKKFVGNSLQSYDLFILIPSLALATAEIDSVLQLIPANKIRRAATTFNYQSGKCSQLHAINGTKNAHVPIKYLASKLKKYRRLVMVFPEVSFYSDFIPGFQEFCSENNISVEVKSSVSNVKVEKGDAFFVTEDVDLVSIIKKADKNNYNLGEDIGVICFNDSLLKELVKGGVTIFKPDYESFGKSLQECIARNTFEFTENSFVIIERSTL